MKKINNFNYFIENDKVKSNDYRNTLLQYYIFTRK